MSSKGKGKGGGMRVLPGGLPRNQFARYRSGTWTPSDFSGAGLALTLNGEQFWVRIGDMVFAGMSVTYPVTADGSIAAITGLPFPAVDTAPNRGLMHTVTTGATPIRGLLNATLTLLQWRNGAAAAVNSDLSGLIVWVGLWYRTNAP